VYTPEAIAEYIEQNNVKELWIALPFRDEKRIKELLYQLRHLSISIKFVPDIFGFRLLNQTVFEVAGMPILQLNGTPIQGINRIIKELEDKILSFIIMILVSPLLILIYIMIKLDSKGPAIYKQIRQGWDGKKIKIYKFRSMYVSNDDKYIQATKNDQRITKVGAFIRRTSLDELPQFLNVLQGRMSIVGPRPHPVLQNEEFKDQVEYYMQRHRVKPGITGWAQVNGLRGETDTLEKMSERVEYDLYYIENWSLWFDIRIIFLTIFKGFVNKNAY
jgi:putative colanic acid biosynthesis UDP-glucose lipid carrier transferase